MAVVEMKLRPPVRPGLVAKLSKEFQTRLVSEWSFSLVGKFNDEWVPQAQTTQDHLSQIWQLSGKMEMFLFPNNTFVFKLDNPSDFHRVVTGGPYSVEDSLLMLQPLPRTVRFDHVRFNKVAVWVTLTGLPAELHDREVAVSVGQHAGKVVDAAVVVGQMVNGRLVRGRCSARVKVEIEAEELLLPGSYVDCGNGSSLWVGFKYEGIPRLCENCLRIGHLDTDCRKTALQARIDLNQRLEAIAKKLSVLMVPADLTMEDPRGRSPAARKTMSCPTDRAIKRCKTAAQDVVADPQAMAMALVAAPFDGAADPDLIFGSIPDTSVEANFRDYGPGSVGSMVDLEASGPKKGVSTTLKRKPKK